MAGTWLCLRAASRGESGYRKWASDPRLRTTPTLAGARPACGLTSLLLDAGSGSGLQSRGVKGTQLRGCLAGLQTRPAGLTWWLQRPHCFTQVGPEHLSGCPAQRPVWSLYPRGPQCPQTPKSPHLVLTASGVTKEKGQCATLTPFNPVAKLRENSASLTQKTHTEKPTRSHSQDQLRNQRVACDSLLAPSRHWVHCKRTQGDPHTHTPGSSLGPGPGALQGQPLFGS